MAFGNEGEFHDPFATEEAPTQPQVKISDPLEPVNRAFFQFNDKLYSWVLRPISKGYRYVAPEPARQCIDRFFTNVKFPVRVVNNLLQGHFSGAGIETGRFVVNSTVGVAGFFDPAARWNLKPQPSNFDRTLAFYRLPTGIYLNWPVFGPSSVRGTVGLAGDAMLNPGMYIDPEWIGAAASGLERVNGTSLHLEEYDALMNGTLDPYVAMRSAYFEHRQSAPKE